IKRSKLAASPLLLDASARWSSSSSSLTSRARHGQRKRSADCCWALRELCKARKCCIRRRCLRCRYSHGSVQPVQPAALGLLLLLRSSRAETSTLLSLLWLWSWWRRWRRLL
ncbi:unnamed protein product, partial [Ectocarpus sp. 13 AM-2016]